MAESDGAFDRIIFGMLASGRLPGMLLDVRKRGKGAVEAELWEMVREGLAPQSKPPPPHPLEQNALAG